MTWPQQQTASAYLKWVRTLRRLSQEALAERCGYSVSYISMLERGVREPPASTIAILAEALQLDHMEQERLRGLLSPVEASPAPTRPPAWIIPHPLTTILGREREESVGIHLLTRQQVRLLTITGPAGVGKTRLALLIAKTLQATIPEVAFISLVAVHDSTRVMSVIAQNLQLAESSVTPPLHVIIAALRERPCVLVLDNVEQVKAAGKDLADLLVSCPHCQMIATSRERLAIRGEYVLDLKPLDVPEATAPNGTLDVVERYAAVALFLQRARAVRADFLIRSPEDARLVGMVCRRLDGLPLAIELAAAQLRHASLAAIVADLAGAAPLNVLEDGFQDQPPHQQTMRATIAWSYGRLNPTEQQLMRWLGLCTGGADQAMLATLSGLAMPSLRKHLFSLVDKHLVVWTNESVGPRYTLLLTIRDFVLEDLANRPEAHAMRTDLAEYVATWLEDQLAALRMVESASLDQIALNLDTIRSVLQWVVAEQSTLVGLRIGGIMWRYWDARDVFREGLDWLTALLALPAPAPTPAGQVARSDALTGVMDLAYRLERYDRARQAGEENLAIRAGLGDAVGLARALSNLANIQTNQGEFAQAQVHYQEALALYQANANSAGQINTLLNLGKLQRDQRDYTASEGSYQACLTLARAAGTEPDTLAILLVNLADLHVLQDRPAEALGLLAEGEERFRSIGTHWGIAMAQGNRGRAERRLGLIAAASASFTAAMVTCQSSGDYSGVVKYLIERALTTFAPGGSTTTNADLRAALALADDAILATELPMLATALMLSAQSQNRADLATMLTAQPASTMVQLPPNSEPYIADLIATHRGVAPQGIGNGGAPQEDVPGVALDATTIRQLAVLLLD